MGGYWSGVKSHYEEINTNGPSRTERERVLEVHQGTTNNKDSTSGEGSADQRVV